MQYSKEVMSIYVADIYASDAYQLGLKPMLEAMKKEILLDANINESSNTSANRLAALSTIDNVTRKIDAIGNRVLSEHDKETFRAITFLTNKVSEIARKSKSLNDFVKNRVSQLTVVKR